MEAPELRSLVERFDWASTPVGPLAGCSQSLHTALGICLSSRFPMIIFWGPELVQFYNDAYVPILGTRHPGALGQRARDCWPDVWNSVGPMLHGVLETGEATWSENFLLPLERNGRPEECYFTFSYSPIAGEGRVAGVFCAVTETTETVLRERHVRERAEALAELDLAKTRFFNNVSHEFRTPLTLMLGPLETLAGAVDPEHLPLVEVARRNALRLLKLVNTLLDFSRIESGRHEASFVSTDLGAMTVELASMFRSAIEKAGLELVIANDLDQPVFVDRSMWEKIVLNLLSNALKFTLQGKICLALTAGTAPRNSRSATRASASLRTTCRSSSNGSGRFDKRGRGRTKAAASDWRWSRNSLRCTAAAWRQRASSGMARPSACEFRSDRGIWTHRRSFSIRRTVTPARSINISPTSRRSSVRPGLRPHPFATRPKRRSALVSSWRMTIKIYASTSNTYCHPCTMSSRSITETQRCQPRNPVRSISSSATP